LPPTTLLAGAVAILETALPSAKVSLSHDLADQWRKRDLPRGPIVMVPDRPARPTRPELRFPRDMPRRRAAGGRKSVALLHAIAHIELNAIDLAWDLIARFGDLLPDSGIDDWVEVADQEALHFDLLSARMEALGGAYGDFPAHDGLWQAAQATAGDLLARLAVVPLVLEARGLDVTPGMIDGFRRHDDLASAAVLERIYQDEIGHVATGMCWFRWACAAQNLDPEETWQARVATYFKGSLKPPFNIVARDQAGFPPTFYEALGAA